MWLLTRIVLPMLRSSRRISRISTRARGSRPGCGLVEDQHCRIVDQRVGQAEPLAHAARKRLDVCGPLVGEADDLEQLADHACAARGRNAVAAREEVEVLPDTQVVVDAVEVGHIADPAPDLDRVLRDRDAADEGLARGRGRSVARIFIVVVLPAPFGPTSP